MAKGGGRELEAQASPLLSVPKDTAQGGGPLGRPHRQEGASALGPAFLTREVSGQPASKCTQHSPGPLPSRSPSPSLKVYRRETSA